MRRRVFAGLFACRISWLVDLPETDLAEPVCVRVRRRVVGRLREEVHRRGIVAGCLALLHYCD